MNRLSTWLIGPELYWLAAYVGSKLVASRTTRADPGSILLLERLSWAIPLVLVPLSFFVFYWLLPLMTARGWLTARLLLATIVGLNACLIAVVGAIDYGDSRNSGVLGWWAIGLAIGAVLWVLAYIVVLFTGARGRMV